MDDDTDDNPSREAARYRTQLRDAEAQRDALTATLTTLQRGRVESIATGHGITPTALWAAGTELDALLGEDGNPDPEAIAEAARSARDKLGLTPEVKPTTGLLSGAMKPPPPADGWRDAFSP